MLNRLLRRLRLIAAKKYKGRHASLNPEDEFAGYPSLFREITARYFLDRIDYGTRVLDCGAGDGAVSLPLAAELGCRVDAIDMRPARIETIERIRGDLPVRGIVGDLMTADLEPGAYDYVISRQFLPHFPGRWKEVLLRKREVCRPGGSLIFQMHSADHFRIMRSLTADQERLADLDKGYPRNGMMSKEDLYGFASENGLEVLETTPILFFMPSSALMKSGHDRARQDAFSAELDTWLTHPDVYAFVRWYETEIIGRLPLGAACSFMAVLRRKPG
jgi:SAM-dependent methyltransferase